MDKKPVGRPAIPEDQKRKTRSIKMSDKEWEELQRKAREAGERGRIYKIKDTGRGLSPFC